MEHNLIFKIATGIIIATFIFMTLCFVGSLIGIIFFGDEMANSFIGFIGQLSDAIKN